LIRQISAQHGIKGYDASPLEKEKIAEFSARLGALQRQQADEAGQIQVRITNVWHINRLKLEIVNRVRAVQKMRSTMRNLAS